MHSMARGSGFHERDMAAARAFGHAAAAAGVERIVYLGGLGDPATELSHHLRSRQETGATLREAGVPSPSSGRRWSSGRAASRSR
jgi:uncharacterized protein YbjT (DUF2867 family)